MLGSIMKTLREPDVSPVDAREYARTQLRFYERAAGRYRWAAYSLYAAEIALAITAGVAALNGNWPRWSAAVPALLIPFIALLMARWQVPQRHVAYALARETIREQLETHELGICDYRSGDKDQRDDLLVGRVLSAMREERTLWKASALEGAQAKAPAPAGESAVSTASTAVP
jgi:hypothetical protein